MLASVRLATGRALLAAVGRVLLDAVDRSQMPLEYIGTVKALLSGRAASRAETADHGALVMRQGMTVLVVLPREALDVILARCDRTLFWSLILVSEHVCLEILENTSTLRQRAETLVARLVVHLEAAAALAAGSRMLRVEGVD